MDKSKSGDSRAAQYVLRAVTVVVLILLVTAPARLGTAAAVFSACTAFPQGSYALAISCLTDAADDGGSKEAEHKKQDGASNSVGTSDDLTKTPSDILELVRAATLAGKNDKYDADISSRTYGKSGATTSYENVCVRNTTETKSLNIEKKLGEDMGLVIEDKTKPSVLIFHTHTTEGFELFERDWYACDTTSRSADASQNIVRVGDEIVTQLERAGFNVIHDKTIHDEPYSGSYKRSRATVQKYLDKYPSIQVTLDIHRDSMQENDGTKIRPVAEINGCSAAQLMIIAGAQEGEITDFPSWQTNLCFALKIQKYCEDMSPGLMRPLLFCQRKYNMDMTPYSLLIEVGSEANTLEQAAYSGRLLGNSLAALLETAVK